MENLLGFKISVANIELVFLFTFLIMALEHFIVIPLSDTHCIIIKTIILHRNYYPTFRLLLQQGGGGHF